MDTIERNAREVLERAAKAAEKSGRKPEEVAVLAASKQNGYENIRAAMRGGITLFGENRVQELTEKLALNAYEGAEIHLIGHLQKNKVKNVVGKVSLIHSADSAELITLIGKRAGQQGIVQDILIEVNIGGEEAKSGIAPEAADELVSFAGGIAGVRVRGLMTIPPVCTDPREQSRYFDKMANLFVDISGKKYDNVNMCTLSMGMSADYEAAILAGANLVRVGTAIFGQRYYA